MIPIFCGIQVYAAVPGEEEEQDELYWIAYSQAYARQYSYVHTYFELDEMISLNGAYNVPSSYHKVSLYIDRYNNGDLPYIYEEKVVSPKVPLIPDASISISNGEEITYSSTFSQNYGIELEIIKDVLTTSASVSLSETFSQSYWSSYSFPATYEFAIQVLGTNHDYTKYAIVHQQEYAKYRTLNYEGFKFTWFWGYKSIDNRIDLWEYVGSSYFSAPLEGFEYQTLTVKGFES